jgi:hypothetical protein
MTDDRLISVITPCYNAEAFIGETIESVLAQTHRAVEHLIIDDCSSDGTWEATQRYATLHAHRLRPERLPVSRGASHARNRGAALAHGQFLMFLDADDLLAPDALEALVAALRQHPSAVAHAPWTRLIRDRHGTWRTRSSGVKRPSSDPDTALRDWLEGGAWVPPSAVLWPHAVFERSGGWDEAFTVDDDGELMRRVLSRGVPLVPAAGGGALYRIHGPERVSLSQSAVTAEQLRMRKAVIDRIADELEGQGRLAAFAPAVGTAYQHVALAALQKGHRELAQECQALGARLGGHQNVSRTALGRALARTVGVERKEQLAQWIARRGIASNARRRSTPPHEVRHREGSGERNR